VLDRLKLRRNNFSRSFLPQIAPFLADYTMATQGQKLKPLQALRKYSRGA
jgi:hypothetical protein